MPTTLAATVTEDLLQLLSGEPNAARLAQALRHLAKWRAHLLENTLVARSGDRVLSGPFQGMAYPVRSTEGGRTPRLIGCYEHSLTPVINRIIRHPYACVIDIGCAEGYYAVGLARAMPGAMVRAHDTDARAQAACRQLALANGCSDRVLVGGEFRHADFAICQQAETLVLCDIEGAEADLLNPAEAQGLLAADILVEVHEGMRPGLIDDITRRFADSHDVHHINRRLDDSGLPDWAETLGDLDRLLLLWEWRASPTPWLWMTRKVRT